MRRYHLGSKLYCRGSVGFSVKCLTKGDTVKPSYLYVVDVVSQYNPVLIPFVS
jgi:hypothetical protein